MAVFKDSEVNTINSKHVKLVNDDDGVGVTQFGPILNHCLPITCLKLFKHYLFVTEGPVLSVYDLNVGGNENGDRMKLCFKKQLFSTTLTIQGVNIFDGSTSKELNNGEQEYYDRFATVIVWAGCYMKMFSLERLVQEKDSCFEKDVIRSVHLRDSTLECEFIPLTVRWLDEGHFLTVLTTLNYLYIFQNDVKKGEFLDFGLYHGSRASLYSGLLSGNTLKDLVIFSGTAYREINIWKIVDGRVVDLQTLTSQKGVCLSLEYDSIRRILLSVSDDRSVVCWKPVPSPKPEEVKVNDEIDGYNENAKEEAWMNLHESAKFFNPDSRIWKSILVRDFIVSVGEGSLIEIHDLTGQQLTSWRGHHSASIYHCAFDINSDVLYTAAQDGSICQWRQIYEKIEVKELLFPEEIGSDFPRTLIHAKEKCILSSMDSGRLLLFNHGRKGVVFCEDPEFLRYAVMGISPTKDFLVIGSLKGNFLIMRLNELVGRFNSEKIWGRKLDKKIVSIHWLSDWYLLVASLNETMVFHVTLTNAGTIRVDHVYNFNVCLEKPGIPTAIEVDGFIILGTESGSLILLKYGYNDPVSIIPVAHKGGVSCLKSCFGKIFSTGQNGCMKTFLLDHEEFVLNEVCSYALPFDSVELLHNVGDGEMLICGFLSTSFVIYGWQQNRILSEIENCGGGHRSWDYYLAGDIFTFSYIREKKLYSVRVDIGKDLKACMQPGLHSKTINCCVELWRTNDDVTHFATGSEDGCLRTLTWEHSSQRFRIDNINSKHISSIRTLSTFQFEKTFYLCSGGGRSQLIVWKVTENKQYSMSSNWKYATRIELEVLAERILCNSKKNSNITDMVDTRIMDVVCSCYPLDSQNEFLILCACSDGTVHIVNCCLSKKIISVIGILYGNEHALLNLYSNITEDFNVYGATSNGSLIIWNLDNEIPLYESFVACGRKLFTKNLSTHLSIQTSAIMSFNMFFDPINRCMSVITGTDEGVVSFGSVIKNETNEIVFDMKWTTQQNVHRGAVVSTHCLPEKNTVIVCSNDQVMSYWEMFTGDLVYENRTGVTDCQGMVMNKSVTLCFGNGITFLLPPFFI